MAKPRKFARSSKPARDVAAEVTEKIIASLEAGVAPWVKPWTGDAGFASMGSLPRNGKSGRRYTGVNVILLWAAGFADPRWFTFNQAKDLGGTVRKGEKGTHIVFWKFIEKEDENGKKSRIGFARTFVVFNAEQCDGLDLTASEHVAPASEHVADELAEANGVTVIRTGARAFYSPSRDTVTVPAVDAFTDSAAYNAILFHEMAHWTGHTSRLARDFSGRFGDSAYAAEELVAELGAAFLCASVGVEGRLQHAEYLGHWIKVLKADKHAIFTAAREAQKAADLLLKVAEETEEEETREAA